MTDRQPFVAIVVASRHGATAEIADAIHARLADRGLTSAVVAADDDPVSVLDADAVILGSAVYAGSWLKAARRFTERNQAALRSRPVWLFSSGPLDDPDTEALPADKVEDLLERTGALSHRVFAGRLDRAGLSRSERLIVRAVKARDGDFRDWGDIAAWADEIAESLLVTSRS